MADSVTESAMSTVIIDKRGDILLKLSKNGVAGGTLLVSSHVLNLASPVFEAMFNGNFAEGQDLSVAGPKEIPVPGDDPSAVTLLCKIIHLQPDLPNQATSDQLADLAVLCDKYQCTDAVSFWSRVQIMGLMSNPDKVTFETLVFVTYVLDLPHEFSEVTLRIARDQVNAMDDHVASHGLDLVPLVVFDQIRGLQARSHQHLRGLLLCQKYSKLLTTSCDKSGASLKFYLKSLANANIKIENLRSISHTAKQAVSLLYLASGVSCHTNHGCMVPSATYLHKEVAEAIIQFHDNMESVCLDCMHKDYLGDKDRTCRLGHNSSSVIDA